MAKDLQYGPGGADGPDFLAAGVEHLEVLRGEANSVQIPAGDVKHRRTGEDRRREAGPALLGQEEGGGVGIKGVRAEGKCVDAGVARAGEQLSGGGQRVCAGGLIGLAAPIPITAAVANVAPANPATSTNWGFRRPARCLAMLWLPRFCKDRPMPQVAVY